MAAKLKPKYLTPAQFAAGVLLNAINGTTAHPHVTHETPNQRQELSRILTPNNPYPGHFTNPRNYNPTTTPKLYLTPYKSPLQHR